MDYFHKFGFKETIKDFSVWNTISKNSGDSFEIENGSEHIDCVTN